MGKYVVALDAGTTSVRAMLFDVHGRSVSAISREIALLHPSAGWAEQDPLEIWQAQKEVLQEVVADSKVRTSDILGIGIANQRETTILWDRRTGEPVYNAIIWQDSRTAGYCASLREAFGAMVRDRTGLIVDSFFSASKVRWILDNVPGVRTRAEAGDILFGTVDSWLLWNITGGQLHETDVTNASRTLLFNIHQMGWDQELLDIFEIPRAVLPGVRPTSHHYGETDPSILNGHSISIHCLVGDQQGALFGQACFSPGATRSSYGTAGNVLMNAGNTIPRTGSGLTSTVAWQLGHHVEYALEGVAFTAGAAVRWLRDELQILSESMQSETIAISARHTGGVFMVPAFVGLAAPYWDPNARAAIVGIGPSTGRPHIVRAALEGIAFQAHDIYAEMRRRLSTDSPSLRVDGGMVRNNFLLQFQADILGITVQRPSEHESTARGAAFLAGLSSGQWKSKEELQELVVIEREFHPQLDLQERARLLDGWHRAVHGARVASRGNEEPTPRNRSLEESV
jgi:glycerol kinase